MSYTPIHLRQMGRELLTRQRQRVASYLSNCGTLRADPVAAFRMFTGSAGVISLSRSRANGLADSLVLDVLILGLSSHGWAVSERALSVLKYASFGVLKSRAHDIRRALVTSGLSESERRVLLRYCVTSAAERDSLLRSRSRWSWSSRAALGDTAALDTLIQTLHRARTAQEAVEAIWHLAETGVPGAALVLVRAWANPCYPGRVGMPDSAKYSVREKIAASLLRYHPSEPLPGRVLDRLIASEKLLRDSAAVLGYAQEFREWARREYGVELPTDTAPVPMCGPCDIRAEWRDSRYYAQP